MSTGLTLQPRPVPGPVPAWAFPAATGGRVPAGPGTLRCDLPGRRLAAVRLVLHAGAGREPGDLDGVATLAARALLEGTEPGGGTALTAAFERLGASLYASADLTALRIALDVPVTRLDQALDLFSSVVRRPALDDADVRRLVRERLEEIAQEDADPGTRAMREVRAVMFPAQARASRPTGGSRASVDALQGSDVRAFYGSVVPAEATAVVAGDLSGVDADAALTAALTGWAGTGGPLPTADRIMPESAARIVVVDRPGSVQTYLAFGHGVPDRSHHDWPSLTVASHVLGGGLTSRLNAVLREEKGYTYGMRAGLLRMRHCGLFLAQGAVHTEVTADAVTDALSELRGIVSRGIDTDEHGASVRALADRAPAEYETARAVAAELADVSANGLGVDYPSAYLAAVRASTPDGVAHAYRKHIDPEALTIIAVGDATQIRDPLENLGYAPVTVTTKE
ncbi:putative Zn-dependent peptidase [Actinomadura pelletieri DSM 43383]|uniref:Putative Zn-dependent peptidase n=1 Tax=Actinomadura pelletieri DSM 43383 TaxID=1120940 RepID=A0A495QJA9_9ACTN|nr:pitrilysin family protein [Actinomadura pelletieri]RKS72221.1 putative Zn-dependent peptidase [Actinomadura pelletieri DSM 43383]